MPPELNPLSWSLRKILAYVSELCSCLCETQNVLLKRSIFVNMEVMLHLLQMNLLYEKY